MSLTRSSLLVASGLILAAGVLPAAAADDGYDNVLSSVATAVGLMKADPAPEIDYRERAPLVLPPKMDLVKPSESIARPASWPQDPDVARRRKAAADARAPMPNLLGNERQVLSREEMQRYHTDAAGNERPESSVRLSQCGQNGNGKGCLAMSPDQLKAEGDYMRAHMPDSAEAELKPGEEPNRVYLTQPPKGYMKATKVVKATSDGPKQYHDGSSPYEFLNKKPKSDDD